MKQKVLKNGHKHANLKKIKLVKCDGYNQNQASGIK